MKFDKSYNKIYFDPFAIILFFVFLSLILEAGVNQINKRLMKGIEKIGINTTPQEIKVVPKE